MAASVPAPPYRAGLQGHPTEEQYAG